MCARFSPQQVSHAVERGCGCARARESAVKSSIAQSTAACTGPAFGGGPARRQPVPPQGAEALAFTGQRTMNTRGTRPGLSPTFYRWAEPSLTVQPLGTGRPLVISAVYRGPDFPRACSSSPDTDGVLQPRKSMTMFDLLAMEPAKAAPIPERNQIDAPPRGIGFLPPERVRGAGRQAEAAVDAVCDLIFQRRVVGVEHTRHRCHGCHAGVRLITVPPILCRSGSASTRLSVVCPTLSRKCVAAVTGYCPAPPGSTAADHGLLESPP